MVLFGPQNSFTSESKYICMMLAQTSLQSFQLLRYSRNARSRCPQHSITPATLARAASITPSLPQRPLVLLSSLHHSRNARSRCLHHSITSLLPLQRPLALPPSLQQRPRALLSSLHHSSNAHSRCSHHSIASLLPATPGRAAFTLHHFTPFCSLFTYSFRK